MLLWDPVDISVGRRDGSHPTHRPGGGRGARRPPADALRTWATPSSCGCAREDAREPILLFAYLDDVYAVCRSHRVRPDFSILQQWFQAHAEIRLHLGKTQVWNGGGVAKWGRRVAKKSKAVETRSNCLEVRSSVVRGAARCLGALGAHWSWRVFRVFLEKTNKDHEIFFHRTPWLNDPQSAWLLLFMLSLRSCSHCLTVFVMSLIILITIGMCRPVSIKQIARSHFGSSHFGSRFTQKAQVATCPQSSEWCRACLEPVLLV